MGRRSCAEAGCRKPNAAATGHGEGSQRHKQGGTGALRKKNEKKCWKRGPRPRKSCPEMQAGNLEPGCAEPDPWRDAQGSRAEDQNAWVAAGGAARRIPEHGEGAGGCSAALRPRCHHLHGPTEPVWAPTAPHKRPRSGEAASSALFRAGKTSPPPPLAACLLLGFAKGEFGPPALKSFNIYASGRPLAPGIGTVTPPEPHDHIPHNNAPQARRARAGFRRPKVPLFLILKHKAAILSKKLTQELRKAGISPGNHASEAARPQLDP